MNKNEAQLEAWARWEIAYERMSLERSPPEEPPWNEWTSDLPQAIQLVRAALDAIEAAYRSAP
jgi:hypothetical protein